MSKHGGTVLKTSLSKEDEKELKEAMHGGQHPPSSPSSDQRGGATKLLRLAPAYCRAAPIISAGVLVVVSFGLGQYWQYEIRKLMGVTDCNIALVVASPFIAALIFCLILLIGRGLRGLYRWAAALLNRWRPGRPRPQVHIRVRRRLERHDAARRHGPPETGGSQEDHRGRRLITPYGPSGPRTTRR
jgi:Alpha/beta-hydrolase family N-terminus